MINTFADRINKQNVSRLFRLSRVVKRLNLMMSVIRNSVKIRVRLNDHFPRLLCLIQFKFKILIKLHHHIVITHIRHNYTYLRNSIIILLGITSLVITFNVENGFQFFLSSRIALRNTLTGCIWFSILDIRVNRFVAV